MKDQLKELFLINPDITFLNFGSFGSCPKPIFERYQQYQRELEEEPVRFMMDKSVIYLQESRAALGSYLNCNQDDIVCITNPSYGVNIVAKSLKLKPGDEILTTDLEYGACDRTWNFVCKHTGAVYKKQSISFPINDKQEIIDKIISGITSKTKMIFLSHITSSTSLRIPVEEICTIASDMGIMTFIDGAHAPAHIEVDLTSMNCDFYAGACHKWMLAPKGSSFLYAKRSMQHLLDPLVVSWGYESISTSHSLFLDYHEVQGTRDLSAFCSIKESIAFLRENNWNQVSQECKDIVSEYAVPLHQIVETEPIYTSDPYFNMQMRSIPIQTSDPIGLYKKFVNEFNIQIPVMVHQDKVYLRYSYNAFNSPNDLDRLSNVLQKLKKENIV